jgi:energy-coupling factor transporter ATP-binding protein EcfA2
MNSSSITTGLVFAGLLLAGYLYFFNPSNNIQGATALSSDQPSSSAEQTFINLAGELDPISFPTGIFYQGGRAGDEDRRHHPALRVEGGASDIHIEPSPEKTRVRFRMDGELHTSLELPAKCIRPWSRASRSFRRCASTRSASRRTAASPRRWKAPHRLPRLDLPDAVRREGRDAYSRPLEGGGDLESSASREDLEDGPRDPQAPYGIILISGPTGSGKSTTLFAMLSELDRETQNVVSLEDPVEYEIPGVAQSQVHPEIGYTFANGLRSILRQDPDVIMVGEIRDKETAQLAIQAALTGHLVFSTIHTNTAAGVIPRLIDMGVDPYLIAPTSSPPSASASCASSAKGRGRSPVSESIKGCSTKEFADLPKNAEEDSAAFEHLYEAADAGLPERHARPHGVFEIMRMDKDSKSVVLTNPVEEKCTPQRVQKACSPCARMLS